MTKPSDYVCIWLVDVNKSIAFHSNRLQYIIVIFLGGWGYPPPKRGGGCIMHYAHDACVFSPVFVVDSSINPKYYYDSLSFNFGAFQR